MAASLTRSDWARIAIATVLAFGALVVVSALGLWQFERAYRDDITQEVLARPAVSVQSLMQPATYVNEFDFAHAVTVDGMRDGAKALLSCDRPGDHCWLVAPVAVNSTHSVIVVFDDVERASATSALADMRASGMTSVTVKGRLQPAEIMLRPQAMLAPADDIAFISTNELVMRWQQALLDGFVVADGVDYEPVTPPSGISWRNLAYAWQWWTFAAFVGFLLVRYILDVRADSIKARQ